MEIGRRDLFHHLPNKNLFREDDGDYFFDFDLDCDAIFYGGAVFHFCNLTTPRVTVIVPVVKVTQPA